jgi:tetratricopeptide (TPR) repeat protein
MIRALSIALTLVIVTPADLTWTDIVARIERGAASSDAAMLASAAADAEKLADVTGLDRERELALLGAAYAAWRFSAVPGIPPADAQARLKAAEKDLHDLLKMRPQSGEAYALLGSVLGQLIRFSGGASKRELGPLASDAREQAMGLEPNNPRVVLQGAMTLYFTPAEYGGGADKAEAGLRQALALFDREPAGRPWPNWGRFDAHAWLGQALAARGDRAGARAEYEQALAVWPRSAWVKNVLIPALAK